MPTIFKTIVKELWWILWTKIIIKGLNLVYMWKWEVSFFRMLDCLFARSQLNIEKREKKKEREQDETVVVTTVSSCSPFYCSIWLIWSSLLCVPKNKALISFSFFFFFLAIITHFLIWFWEIICFSNCFFLASSCLQTRTKFIYLFY